MSRIILSTGNYAEIPYFFEKTYVNLYSMEELCYTLVENVELLDQDIVSEKMARWIDEQCGLPKLAHALYGLINQKCSASAYVGTILEYIGLYPADTIAHIETVIKDSAGMNPFERQKAKGDYMLQNKRYTVAIERYDELLERLPDEEKEVRAKALHNRGVANARLFLFAHAQEDFMEAYRISSNKESLKQFLAARRMQDNDKDYVEYIAEHPNLHEASLQVERLVEQAAGAFEMTDENRMLFTLRVCKEEESAAGGVIPYYNEIEKLTAALKDAYRECVAR
ncbi:MAG: hypothetical protein NC314_10295 [Roseburia sp.]|nr:hypothetical protein [Ruminococcus sp.]MCM1155100.1 hypothetical protein [Roseburia sp.]MCM1243220.1 hypothetical protein [Roseburia sp.]